MLLRKMTSIEQHQCHQNCFHHQPRINIKYASNSTVAGTTPQNSMGSLKALSRRQTAEMNLNVPSSKNRESVREETWTGWGGKGLERAGKGKKLGEVRRKNELYSKLFFGLESAKDDGKLIQNMLQVSGYLY